MNLRELSATTIYQLGLARWLFIHIPKNAGMAIRKNPELSNCLVSADPWFHFNRNYTQELAAYMAERGEHHGFQHARLRDIRADVRARLQPVAVVRNPWARVVSRYRFARTAIEIGTADDDYVAPTFEAFLEERHVHGNLPFYWHRAIRGWYLQKDYGAPRFLLFSGHLAQAGTAPVGSRPDGARFSDHSRCNAAALGVYAGMMRPRGRPERPTLLRPGLGAGVSAV
ncbi:hypothetical protein [Roseovarius sp. SYSU LYC5161]|uniref:hypothetical protein n=1 Tax=Roseovarius halophilus (ex Wu et al. 2025) TaxID=3376060 RepID=UPI00399BB8C4